MSGPNITTRYAPADALALKTLINAIQARYQAALADLKDRGVSGLCCPDCGFVHSIARVQAPCNAHTETGVCESTAALIPVLPTLTAVLPAHSAHPVELHFTDPAQTWQDGALTRPVNLSTPVGDAQVSAALLCPLPDGGAVLLADWRDSAALTLYVPATLMADVRLALGLSVVTG